MLLRLEVLWTSANPEVLASCQFGGFQWVLVLVAVEVSTIAQMVVLFVGLAEARVT